jgi:hypothetical protein
VRYKAKSNIPGTYVVAYKVETDSVKPEPQKCTKGAKQNLITARCGNFPVAAPRAGAADLPDREPPRFQSLSRISFITSV